MLQIDDTILSMDILQVPFCCDLEHCEGQCCVDGESGAPLEADETVVMAHQLEPVLPFMTAAGREVVKQVGVFVTDADGDLVTPLVDGKECVFVVFDQGIAFCAFEKAFLEGKTTFRKPVSCHLYPIRITHYPEFDAVNYHRWNICSGACRLGDEKKVPLYVFLREPLIRKYGKDWYEQLCYAAEHLTD